MSIPKGPRQLMINLMYLVLTAMLALNVSAEIINAFFALNKGTSSEITNAFFALNKGMITSNAFIEKYNIAIKGAIDKQVEAYNNPTNQGFKSTAEKTTELVKDFESYISGITKDLVSRAGGPNPKYKDGRPIRYKDKDITTNLFLKEGKGAEIEKKVKDLRAALLGLFTDPTERKEMEAAVAIDVDAIPEDSKAKNWPELKFNQIPVAACMPILTKLVADAKVSETAILNKMMEKVGGKDIKFDNFKVAIAPKTGYVITGEEFSADVYLAAYSSNPGTDVTIRVNGASLPLKDGVALYKTTASSSGKQTVIASASIRNPMTNEVKTVEGTFDYEVGQRSAALSVDKMNVFYIGVDNPISVAVVGASSNDIRVSGSGCNVSGSGTKYTVTASTVGEAVITVTAGPVSQKFPFLVKRIPNPVPVLGRGPDAEGGLMTSSEFKAQRGIAAIFENFDFEAKCSIVSYELTHVRKNQGAYSISNRGSSFSGGARTMIEGAGPGDSFLFDDIKARCPGDQADRKLGSLSFRIK